MPYLLTSNPGSPTSWVKMDPQNGHQLPNYASSQDPQQRIYGTRQTRPLPPLGGNVTPNTKNIPFFNPNYAQTLNTYHPNNGYFGTLNLGNYSNGVQSSGTNVSNGLLAYPGTPPHLQQLSPTSALSNYSLSRNLNHLNLNIAPRTGR